MTRPVKAEFEILDERFRFCHGDQWLERLHGGCRWTEGPAWFPAGRYLVFSDIPNDRTLRWDEATGAVGVFRQPAGYANGHTVDRQGRLVSCEQGGRRVTRTEHDGAVTVLADSVEGKRLNSPNDIVERSDGSIAERRPAWAGGQPAGTHGKTRRRQRLHTASGVALRTAGQPVSRSVE